MTTPDEQALAALRRLDGPRRPDASAHARIEAQILARFDDAVARRGVPGQLELVDNREVQPSRSRRRWSSAVLTAAAVAVLVAGLVVATTWRSAERDAPSTQPTVGTEDDALVTEQLRVYCETYLPPVDEAAARFAAGLGTDEARNRTLIALEQAAQGLVDLPAPAQRRVAPDAERVVEAAADARLAVALEVAEDFEVTAALDTLDEVITAIDGTEVVAACRRP